MPSLQQTTINSESPSQQEQQPITTITGDNSNNNNHLTNCENDNNINLVLDTTGYVQRMRMPSGALRDVDELVNEIKLNLRLKADNNIRNNCCCDEESTRGGSSLLSCCGSGGGGGGKVKPSRGCRLQGGSAPYYVRKAITGHEGNEENHFTSFQTWHRRHHPQQQQQRQQQVAGEEETSNSPYELLQELLKEGGLIKEAVRRINFDTKIFDYEKDEYESSSYITFLPSV